MSPFSYAVYSLRVKATLVEKKINKKVISQINKY